MNFTTITGFYKNLFTSSRRWMLFIVVIFVLSGIGGFIYFSYQPKFIQDIFDFFQKLTAGHQEDNGALVWIIFKQNLTSTLFALVGGMLLALIPVAVVLFNGFIIGFVIHFLFRSLPTGFWVKLIVIFVTLLPHGIFEIPIVLFSAALGCRLGIRYLLPSSKGMRKQIWKEDAKLVILFIPLLIIVLVVAAFIEVFVSSKLALLFAAGLGK
jgi:stage II sporulation protein M